MPNFDSASVAAEAKLPELAPPDAFDPVIEAYKRDVDRTLLRENLKLTPAERAEKFQRAMLSMFEIRRVAQQRRSNFRHE